MRLDGFPHCGDIVLMGLYDSERHEIQTFEELVGSHGGLGGAQSDAFLLAPQDWCLAHDEINSPEELHQIFVRWRSMLAQGRVPDAHVDVVARDAL